MRLREIPHFATLWFVVKGRGLLPGAHVGAYEVIEPLGRGGMARVYLARSPEHREVALKVLEPEFAGQARSARFAREVDAAARLCHPGCARLIDHGSTRDGLLYLVIERLGGPTLREALSGRSFMSIREVLEIGSQLCAALAHAHAAGVMHRDIKPENVMYRGPGATGGVVLIDFGLSRLRDDVPLTMAGTCLGSPSYVAPERLLERPADGRADLYALGVVLYELTAGRPPFVAPQPLDIARQHIITRPQPLSDLRATAPAGLVAIIHRALEKQPELRFARAEIMADALEDILLDLPEDTGGEDRPRDWPDGDDASGDAGESFH
jgi:serine/threonine protein kinase